eukprot:Nk52_evm15s295 gene=Nk52_evmTU15s295
MAFDGCCPNCRIPGDDCPLVWGECSHCFHMHCILKWVETSQQGQGHRQQCPMCRRDWQFKTSSGLEEANGSSSGINGGEGAGPTDEQNADRSEPSGADQGMLEFLRAGVSEEEAQDEDSDIIMEGED